MGREEQAWGAVLPSAGTQRPSGDVGGPPPSSLRGWFLPAAAAGYGWRKGPRAVGQGA